MIENLTVAVTCRCMVYESDLENFLHNRNLPKIKDNMSKSDSDLKDLRCAWHSYHTAGGKSIASYMDTGCHLPSKSFGDVKGLGMLARNAGCRVLVTIA